MKKLTILLFSILISFSSYGEWTKIGESTNGNTHYMDKDTIKEHGGYIYWWEMESFSKLYPGFLYLSTTSYKQGECGIHRFKVLTMNKYKKPMTKGGQFSPMDSPSKWRYPAPNTFDSLMLATACDNAK
jgi:hypothetical protein